jgi:hypothetical protein
MFAPASAGLSATDRMGPVNGECHDDISRLPRTFRDDARDGQSETVSNHRAVRVVMFLTAQRSPRYDKTKRTMTIAPTSQMMLFMRFPLVWVTGSVQVLNAIHWTPATTVRVSLEHSVRRHA